MKSSFKHLLAGLVVAASVAGASATPISLSYSSTIGSTISFDGSGNFGFNPTANNFQITSAGISAGLLGEMTGTYAIGAITTVGTLSTANVTGTGTLVIHDGLGNNLTGTLVWDNIQQSGTGGSLNIVGNVNVTGVTYTGANTDLLAMLNGAIDTLSFQFATTITLADLKTSANTTSFSGSITAAPDGGLCLAMLGFAMVGVEGLRRKLAK